MYKNEMEIDVIRCLKALIKSWKFIAIMTVIFLIVGFGLTLDKGIDTYGAKATVYAAADNSYTEAANAVTAMNAYLDVAKSYKVCQRASLLLGRSEIEASDVQRSIYISSTAQGSGSSAAAKANSATIISFTATTADENLSMEMADAMAQAYTIEMNSILHSDSIKVLDNAYTSYKAYDSFKDVMKKRLKIMALGFAIACLIVIAFEILDRKVRTVREATIGGNLPVIGIIPEYKE